MRALQGAFGRLQIPLRLVTSAGHSQVITSILVGKPASKTTRGSDSPVPMSLHGSGYRFWHGGYSPKVLAGIYRLIDSNGEQL
jgi:hypothetical protein